MKKITAILACLIFTAGISYAQEVFLTLTKYDESFEKLPVNITVISEETIRNSRAQTLAELLEYETGIVFKSDGTVGAAKSIFIRGASSLQTLVLIDGRRINDIGLGSPDFTSIPLPAVEKIEIIRGSGAAVYGTSAFGGVINVITKKASGDSPLLDASFSYGSFNTFNYSATGAYGTEKIGGLLSFSNIISDGHRKNSEFNGYNTFASFRTALGDSSKLFFTGNIYSGDYDVPGSVAWATPDNRQKDNNKYAKLDYALNPNEDFLMNLSGYFSYNIRDYYDATGNGYDPTFTLKKGEHKYTSETYGAQTDFHYKDLLLAGFEWWKDDYGQKEKFSGYELEKNRTNYAGYAQLNLSFFDGFRLLPGVRYDNNSQFGDVVTPSLSAVFNAGEHIKISANGGKVWRAPVFTELYWNETAYNMYGNPDLKTEKGISADAGVEFSRDKIRVVGSFFYIASEDLIVWDFSPATFETHAKNIDKAVQYGFEFEAGYIMSSWLSHKLSYTYLNAENDETGKKLTYRPENTLSYTVSVKPFEKLACSGTLFYKDRVFTDAKNTKNLNELVTFDFDIKYALNENFTLWTKVLNAGNADYELSQGFPMPKATVYGGVSVKIWK